MLAWIIQITIISFIFIFLIHHLIQFFTNTLTVPKVKDLVNKPSKKYESIYEILSKSKNFDENPNIISNNINNTSNSTDIQLLPVINEKDEMKNELKNFLKSQLNTNEISSKNVDSISYYQFK